MPKITTWVPAHVVDASSYRHRESTAIPDVTATNLPGAGAEDISLPDAADSTTVADAGYAGAPSIPAKSRSADHRQAARPDAKAFQQPQAALAGRVQPRQRLIEDQRPGYGSWPAPPRIWPPSWSIRRASQRGPNPMTSAPQPPGPRSR